MPQQSVYRIYTGEKNKRAIVSLVARQFESFTLQPTIGYYRNNPEKSIVIEIVEAARSTFWYSCWSQALPAAAKATKVREVIIFGSLLARGS